MAEVSSNTSSKPHGSDTQATLAFVLLIAVMVATPIFRGGSTPLAALGNQLLALSLLVVVLWSPRRIMLQASQAVAILVLCVLPAIYLLPIPEGVVAWMPGREFYNEAGAFLVPAEHHQPTTLAIAPEVTTRATLSLLLPIAVFMAVRLLRPSQIEAVVMVVIVIAALQALLGLLQYGTAQGGGVPLKVEGSHWLSAVGTYANRNHMAGLIALVLPVSLGLVFFAFGRATTASHIRTNRRTPIGQHASQTWPRALGLALITLLLIVGVIFTRSRAGIVLAMIGLILGSAVFSRQLGEEGTLRPVFLIAALASMVAISLGLAPVIDRFTIAAVEDDLRWEVFEATWHGLADLFPFGGGAGAFATVFPAYQTLDLGERFINRAHNDYLEYVFDLGIVGLLIIGAAAVLFFSQVPRLLNRRRYERLDFIRGGAAIGIVMLCIHELIDYNLAVPANQVVFALLFSIILYGNERRTSSSDQVRKTTRMDSAPSSVSDDGPTTATPPSDQIENPFRHA